MQSFATVKTALAEAPRFDALILDGKPNASDQTAEIAGAADLVVLEGEVGVSTAYGSASDAGKAITETSFRTLNERASKLAQSVIDKMAELQERQVA